MDDVTAVKYLKNHMLHKNCTQAVSESIVHVLEEWQSSKQKEEELMHYVAVLANRCKVLSQGMLCIYCSREVRSICENSSKGDNNE